MEMLDSIIVGLGVAITGKNLLVCFTGALIGTLIGVLPGLGPAATISLLLPGSYYLDPTSSIIMLAGVYYGAMYGGSITSILVNIPGEAASVVTCLDGYQMALRGRAGPALGISAFGSFIAGTLSLVGLMVAAPPLATFALRFGPPEYFALIVLAFSLVTYLAAGSILKALMMVVVGLIIGTVGADSITGDYRFTYGSLTLANGLGLVPVVMGLFGITEVLANLEEDGKEMKVLDTDLKGLLPNLKDWKDSLGPIFRGSLVGFFIGILPGGGGVVASFSSYAMEKKLSTHPEEFGKGAIAGVSGPESANNAAVSAGFIPLLTLGVPTNVVMALILGAMMMHGIRPGPTIIQEYPTLFWGVIMSMYIGNVMLLVLNIPLIGIWVRLLNVPYRILFPLILLFCIIGSYSLNGNVWEIFIMIIFGIIGILMRKFKYEPAPLVFALVLGPLMENAFRQSLLMSEGSFSIFFTRPISLTLLIPGIVLFIIPLLPWFSRKKVI